MKDDPEINAMFMLKDVLGPLDGETREHVLKWANERFGVRKMRIGSKNDQEMTHMDCEDVGSIFDAANPGTDAEKALVVGYWLQVIKGRESFEGFAVNSELKNLGYGVSNITRAFEELQRIKPIKARQVQKSGKTKQARKKYKITQEGIRKVESMLSE